MGSRDDSDATVRASDESRAPVASEVRGDGATLRDGNDPPASPDRELPAGTRVGEYEIEAVAGRGGFGTVYRAVQPLIGKRVAIKLLSRKYSADQEMVSRFAAEARAVNQIRHRHIIDIFSFGALADGRQYYVMEHLDGEPLDRYLARNGPLTVAEALPILRAVARALDAAHAKGVAHRDLKPENVFLAKDDEGALFPKLLDFGIAKLSGQEDQLAHRTNTGVPIGTPYYMSPEQCRGRDVDHRTDLYSFGVLSYRLLTGAYPFEGDIIDVLHKQMYEEPPPPSSKNPSLPPHVDAAIAWMMQKDPAQRPRNVITAVVALQDDKTPTPALTPSAVQEAIARGPQRQRSRVWLAVAAGTLVLAGAVAAFVTLRDDARGSDAADVDRAPSKADPASALTPEQAELERAIAEAKHEQARRELERREARAAATADPAAKASEIELSPTVTIDVRGVPPNTEVLHAGKLLGKAPGPIALPRGDAELQLTFRAHGFATRKHELTPDRDKEVLVELSRVVRPTKRTRIKPPETGQGADDIPSVFGEEK